ncbi:hypothetical protein [Streptomyces sp. NRRL S-31]|nr:hypothetical protein [Streptomyces sp. NRRL S-31]
MPTTISASEFAAQPWVTADRRPPHDGLEASGFCCFLVCDVVGVAVQAQ